MNLARIFTSSVMPRVASVLASSGQFAQSRCAHLLAQARQPTPSLLQLPAGSNLLAVPSCGLKQKGVLKRRCKDCYFVYRDGRKYVMCKSKPRHKAAAFAPREKFTWVLSPGPMQCKQRPW
ncbi:Hypothetical predicted protein [Cloeon dipterum]|uniref:Large ribosomal subunit protein bL36m n=1 Tax=Cloeon dipterum TaxID=197152 RepID=A0A8S1DGB4_9INSE|nr:Hypothetical predicted protein [Cloeon dipterum]